MPFAVVVALPIRPTPKSRFREDLLLDLPLLSKLHERFEIVNLLREIGRNPPRELLFPRHNTSYL